MSKDRQQQRNTHVPTAGSRTATMELREQPQASVTKDGDKTPERFQVGDLAKAQADLPTMTAFELDTLGMRLPEVMKRGAGEDDSEFRARLSVRLFALLPLSDRTPAKIIEHAERLTRGQSDPESDHLLGIPQLAAKTPADNVFIRQGAFASPPRKITIDVEVNGTEDMERLSQTILRQIHAMLLMKPSEPAKPPVNIPKAVHHLTKAAVSFSGLRYHVPAEALGDIALKMIRDASCTEWSAELAQLSCIATALDLDVHAGGAAKDVRAAIEALS